MSLPFSGGIALLITKIYDPIDLSFTSILFGASQLTRLPNLDPQFNMKLDHAKGQICGGVSKRCHDENSHISVQKAVAKKSAPKSSATQKHGTGQKSTSPPPNLPAENSSTVTRKTMNIFEIDMEGLGCQFITGGDEDNADESADSSLHHEDDQKRNSTSKSEDEDVISPTPPFPLAKRKRANQYVKSVEKFKSQQEKFVTPTRSKKALAKNSDSQILTSLDVNMFDTPSPQHKFHNKRKLKACAGKNNMIDEQATEPVYAELHSGCEYKDKIDVLQNQISFLIQQIRDSTVELKIERDCNRKIFEKDTTILRLQ
ncbi:hypothetical protein DAPPUDRAFT_326581 [Daphnia pulex]|uniref:Uncharacterized protein n=1 Tax=Daphnia pulex TaxID=6669 RepID=E9H865_DAPPU|nr:hypothetical protein DAPPUDRAFT_326581 [Daphnia pulex]|eukprot:EFX72018.1 hypothetical protein DAPPUDRAFT_326581 [Daphnia pulex]